MIPRETRWTVVTGLLVLLITDTTSQDDKSYEETDWIPVTPAIPRATGEKKASDRVLSLDAPAQRFVTNEDYGNVKKRFPSPPLQEQQLLREATYKKGTDNARPRKIKYQPEYRFETPPPPPPKDQPQINYYNSAAVKPYLIEQSPPPIREQPEINYYNNKPHNSPYLINQPPVPAPQQQNYYLTNQQSNNRYVPVPSVNPQAPAVDAPSLYDQYNLPFNTSFYHSLNPTSINDELYQAINGSGSPVHVPKPKESVDVLYVPVEDLNKPVSQESRNSYKPTVNTQDTDLFRPEYDPRQNPYYSSNLQSAQNAQNIYGNLNSARQQTRPSISDTIKGERLAQIQQDFTRQALQAHRLQQQLDQGQVPLEIVTTTTPKPKKRKPHQPPLAVFMESAQPQGDISEVLEVLKQAKSIAVQDTITKNSPKIFIGPSNLDSHDGYLKFPLPYLNNVDGNRIEKKIEQLPFFVAPLSYKTPQGYSKIPLPSPHVGSVVVSTAEKPTTPIKYNSHANNLPRTIPRVSGYVDGGYNNLEQNVGKNGISYRSTTPNSFNVEPTFTSNIKYSFPYQSTTQNTPNEQPLSPNVNSYQSNLRQPDVYNLQTDTFEQGARSTVRPATLDFNRNQNTYKEQTVKPYKLPDILSRVIAPDSNQPLDVNQEKDNNAEKDQKRTGLPEINPLELAITEFELDQINNQYVEPNKKIVKHANAKAQTRFEYENVHTSTSTPTSRGRVQYENQQTTERAPSTRRRGRTRPPARTTTRTTTTTTTTTTAVPENERYTVLEEFVATQPVREYSENYQTGQYDSSRRSSTPVPEYATYSPYLAQNTNPLHAEIPSRSSTTESQSRYLVEEEELYRRPYSEPQGGRNPSAPTYSEPDQPQPNNQYLLEKEKLYLESQTPRRNPTSTPYTMYHESPEKQNRTTDINNYESRFENYNNKQVENTFLGDTNTRNVFDSNNQPQASPSYDTDLNNKQFTQEISSLSGSGVDQFQNIYQAPPQSNSNISPATYVEDNFRSQQPNVREEISDNSERLNTPDYDDHFINPFEDQAVRSLLASNLLVPSTQQQTQTTPLKQTPTEAELEIPATSESPKSTTTPRSRGRQRGRQPSTSSSSTATSAPRRNANRRRPSRPSATERVDSGLDYSSRESADSSKLSNSNSKQRFRTRGRPLHNVIGESTSTTEDELSSVKQPALEGGFEASFNKEPESYMQFAHVIDDQQIITAQPREEEGVKEYHQVYSLQSPSSTDRQFVEYDNTNIRTTPVVDVEIRHPVVDDKQRNSDIITTADENEQYVRYNANIRAGGTLNNNKNVETSRQAPRMRTRTRGRSRFASSTTARPTTRTVSSTYRTTTQAQEEPEFFGFIKTPNFAAQSARERPSEVTPRTEESSVQFVGEIRPKYNTRTATTNENRDTQDVPRVRTRTRTRPPTTRTNNNIYNQRQSDNEVNGSRNAEQITRRSEIRTRGRGSTHFRNPENVKRDSDEDVENGNYPEKFLQRLETTRPLRISAEASDDDQTPHASIHKPKILPKPEGWLQPVSFEPNQIQSQEKTHSKDQRADQTLSTVMEVTENSEESVKKYVETEDLVKLDKTTTTEVNEDESVETSTPRKPGRRRGVWKVIRHRVVDPLEAAESQNYQSVLNAFESIQKIEPHGKLETSNQNEDVDGVTYSNSTVTPKASTDTFFDAIYEMFGVFKDKDKNESVVTFKSTEEPVIFPTTTSVDPTFPEEITEDSVAVTTDAVPKTESNVEETTTDTVEEHYDGADVPSTSTGKFEVEPWEMKAVKTSTSTEVSHETEICYKGRCIKSKGRKGYKHGIVK